MSEYSSIGDGVLRELELLVTEGGLMPFEALASGTKNMTLSLKTFDETGTISVGKRADLVLLEGNPLQDISQVRHRAGVMIGGWWLPREAFEQRLLAFLENWLMTRLPGPRSFRRTLGI